MADEFDWKHEWREPPHGPHKMLHVVDQSLFPKSLQLVIQENHDRATGRHVDIACWGHEAWNKSEQVARNKKHRKRAYDPEILVTIVTDVTFQLLIQELHKKLERLLKAARRLDGVARSQDGEEDDEGNQDDGLHDH